MTLFLIVILPFIFDYLFIPQIKRDSVIAIKRCIFSWFAFLSVIIAVCCDNMSNRYIDNVPRVFHKLMASTGSAVD